MFSVKIEFPGRAQDIHAVPPGAAFVFGHSDGTYTALKATVGDRQGIAILCTPREGVWSGADLQFAGGHNPNSAGPSALKRFAFYEGLVRFGPGRLASNRAVRCQSPPAENLPYTAGQSPQEPQKP